jgi:hypothetical protein
VPLPRQPHLTCPAVALSEVEGAKAERVLFLSPAQRAGAKESLPVGVHLRSSAVPLFSATSAISAFKTYMNTEAAKEAEKIEILPQIYTDKYRLHPNTF